MTATKTYPGRADQVDSPVSGPLPDPAVRTLRHRAGRAALLVTLRGFLIKGIALGGTLVFARLLTPSDFGFIALGSILVMVGTVLADAGLGGALIRRREPPVPRELSSVLGCGLTVGVAIVAISALLALTLGRLGEICFLMAWSVPFAVLRSPAVIHCERSLNYHPLVLGEVGEVLAYNVWGLGAVVAGFGVWGLASAAVIRAVVGSVLVIVGSGTNVPSPGFKWNPLRPLLAFGLRFQAVSLVNILRDLGVNVGTAILAGVATLGVWSLAFRIIQVPYLIFDALWRVSYPAMARLIEAGDEPGPALERATALIAMIATLPLTLLATCAYPLVPQLFGTDWSDAASVIPPAAAGLAIMGPISVASAGYLYAVGEAGIVLRGAVLHTLAWFIVGFSLLGPVGVAALGFGWLAACLVETAVLGLPTIKRTGARLFSAVHAPLGSGVLAAVLGASVISFLSPSVAVTAIGAVTALLTYVGVLAAVARPALRDGLAIGRVLRSANG